MSRRQPTLPRLWLMTDERQRDRLWLAIHRLPRGAGIIFRHHATRTADRHMVFGRITALARERGLIVLVAGEDRTLRADGSHHRRPGPPRFGTAPAHDIKQIRAAERSGATAILLSPVFTTRSHPEAKALGTLRFAALIRATQLPVVALGGMDGSRFKRIGRLGSYGWAAIDAWSN